jgi:hypothetical protein
VGLAIDADSRAYITDPDANFLEKFTVAGVPLLTFEDHAIHGAAAVGVDSGGGIYVADPRAGVIHLFWPGGDLLRNFAIAPQRGWKGAFVFSIDSGGAIFVPDPGGSRVQIFNVQGRLEKSWRVPPGADGSPSRPMAAVASEDGFVYVGDAMTGTVSKFTREGERAEGWTEAAGTTRAAILGLAGAQGHIFVLRDTSPHLEVLAPYGKTELTDNLGGRLGESSQGAFLATGPGGELLVLDAAAPRVLRFRTHLKTASIN